MTSPSELAPLRLETRPVSRRFAALALCLIAAIPVGVLWSFRASGFVADDIFFGANFWITSWRELLIGAWPHGFPSSKAWRPVILLTYFVQHKLAGGQAEPFHVFNYALHGLNAALVSVLVRKMSGRLLTGLLAGALFAVHPMCQENVLWISGRTYPVVASFLLALCLWTLDSGKRQLFYQQTIAIVLMILAVGAYEFGIVAPLLIASLKWRAWKSDDRPIAAAARDLVPCLAVLFGYLLFRWIWLSDFHADVVMAARSSRVIPGIKPIQYRLLDNALLFGWRLLDWPLILQKGILRFSVGGLWTTVCVVVALIVVARDERLRLQGLSWVLFAAVCFLPVAAYASYTDRFGYLSIAGLTALLATAVVRLIDSNRLVTTTAACTGVGMLGLLWIHDLRAHARDWQEAGTLATQIVNQTVPLLPAPVQPLDAHVIGVPEKHGSAWVFITYFPLAVHSRYPLPNARQLHFHLHAEIPPETIARELKPVAEHDERILAWNKATQQMVLHYWREAGSSDWKPHSPNQP